MTATLALAAVSYSLDGAADASGIGKTNISAAIKAGNLIAHYQGSKPIILAIDLASWVESLPTKKQSG